jgi:phytoene dehydrogenase-like protein
MQKFVGVLAALRTEMYQFPSRKIHWWEYITRVMQFRTMLKYRKATLQDVYDECGMSKESQAVISANAGDMMSPPEELSIYGFLGLFGGYNTGAYYPTKHFKYYIDRLAQFITDKPGCHIYYETPVTKINTDGDHVTSVETADGKTFTAAQYICNMDPQSAAHKLIGWEKVPTKFRKALTYDYCPSGMVIYLGLKDIDLKKYGFGKFNTWHLEQWDMNKNWKEQLAGDFSKPWIFISTPTLHSSAPGTAPAGHQIMEIATVTDYDSFKKAQDRDMVEYARMKRELAERILDLVEEKYVPDLRKHIAMKVVGTSVTSEDYVLSPFGSAYGSVMNPKNMGLGRLKAKTPWNNLFWCNASSGYAGLYGTVHTGMQLYMDLTGDRFYDASTGPTDEEFIAALPKQ